MYKSLFKGDSITPNEAGASFSGRCTKLVQDLLEEFKEYSPRELETMFLHTMSFEVVMKLIREHGWEGSGVR